MTYDFTSSTVLMGDLVASRQAASASELHRHFNTIVERMNRVHGDLLVSPLTITLGDEFQGRCRNLRDAFRIAAEMRLRFLREEVRCRFVVGWVRVETPINRQKAWNMMGPGFAEAREMLLDDSNSDHRHEDSAYRFSLLDQPIIERLLNALGGALTIFEEDWTSRQCELATHRLLETAQSVADMAKLYEVSERSIYNVLKAARLGDIENIRDAIEETLSDLDDKRWEWIG